MDLLFFQHSRQNAHKLKHSSWFLCVNTSHLTPLFARMCTDAGLFVFVCSCLSVWMRMLRPVCGLVRFVFVIVVTAKGPTKNINDPGCACPSTYKQICHSLGYKGGLEVRLLNITSSLHFLFFPPSNRDFYGPFNVASYKCTFHDHFKHPQNVFVVRVVSNLTHSKAIPFFFGTILM